MNRYRIKGIIFDMDNTILRSKIDFEAMKREIFRLLTSNGIIREDFPVARHTTSTLIQYAQSHPGPTEDLLSEMWNIAEKYEVIGMQDADLEPGAAGLLDQLRGICSMVIVTNNSIHAAKTALSRNHIEHYFDHIIGREQMASMKPAPDGFHVALQLYPEIKTEEWISVGDAWIDGKAAQEAGVRFISYRGNLAKMSEHGVYPFGSIDQIGDLLPYLA
ncbi:HAD family hydrolase [Paenibacillus tarimensis]